MPEIRVLDVGTANRIAAGEVVERPASIVKELIENSLDADATAVTVEIREGGIDYLRVTDNGSGFPAEQTRIAFERHATSKLRSGDSLSEIASLGFRGEALPSIAAVSKVELTSRQRGQQSGVRLTIEGGAFKEVREAGCPEGTTMVVRDLFFNTPARRAFLKRPATEGGYVGDVVLQQALSRCDASFRLVINGRTVFHTPGDGDVMRCIQVLFGREIAADLIPIQGQWAGGRLSGFVGLQDSARANRQREYFAINGRYVRSPLIASALEEAAKGRIAIGRYPFCALYLDMPLAAVDVNVHPNKLEVRFRDEGTVRAALFSILQDCLRPQNVQHRVPLVSQRDEEEMRPVERAPLYPQSGGAHAEPAREGGILSGPLPPMPSPWSETEPPMDEPPVIRAQRTSSLDGDAPSPRPEAEQPQREVAQPKLEVEQSKLPVADQTRLIGALFTTYVLAERAGEFLLIDQHAAHERLLYDQLAESVEKGTCAQPLLVPHTFDVTPREGERLREHIHHLTSLGFSIEQFGPTTYRVSTVPHILGEPQLKDFFIELIDNLDSLSSLRAADLKRDAIARIACHKAIKAGDRLGEGELIALLDRVLEEDAPLTCPHGRPVLLRMTRDQLEKRFRRVK